MDETEVPKSIRAALQGDTVLAQAIGRKMRKRRKRKADEEAAAAIEAENLGYFIRPASPKPKPQERALPEQLSFNFKK